MYQRYISNKVIRLKIGNGKHDWIFISIFCDSPWLSNCPYKQLKHDIRSKHELGNASQTACEGSIVLCAMVQQQWDISLKTELKTKKNLCQALGRPALPLHLSGICAYSRILWTSARGRKQRSWVWVRWAGHSLCPQATILGSFLPFYLVFICCHMGMCSGKGHLQREGKHFIL